MTDKKAAVWRADCRACKDRKRKASMEVPGVSR